MVMMMILGVALRLLSLRHRCDTHRFHTIEEVAIDGSPEHLWRVNMSISAGTASVSATTPEAPQRSRPLLVGAVSTAVLVLLLVVLLAMALSLVAIVRTATVTGDRGANSFERGAAFGRSASGSEPEVGASPVSITSSSGSYAGPTRSISTEGTAVQRVAPDIASVKLLVNTRASSAAAAQKANDDAQRGVIAAVRSVGIESKNINPSGFLMVEEERIVDDVRLVEFVVSTEVHIETKNLANVSAVLGKAFAAGATTGSVEFRTTRLRELRDQARKDAVKAAKEKARDLTGGVDASVGEAISIQEGTFGYWGPAQQNFSQNSVQVASNQSSMDSSREGGSMDDQFGGGLISVTASVSITFEML
jgi:uncharacterized protein